VQDFRFGASDQAETNNLTHIILYQRNRGLPRVARIGCGEANECNFAPKNKVASIAFGSEKALVLWPSKEQRDE
jgi:hypothetical protein